MLISTVNGRAFDTGVFEVKSLAELRREGLAAWQASGLPPGRLTLDHVAIGDVFEMHSDVHNHGATFQVASQFNCLEFPDAHITPEMGVSSYDSDPTQGPACSLAAAAGTVVRNYFAVTNGKEGQTANNQLNNLDDLEAALGPLWSVRNGYTHSSSKALARLPAAIAKVGRDALLPLIKVGVHQDVGVTFSDRYTPLPDDCDQKVTQVFCSAISCGYSGQSNREWAPLATMVLDACYEATLWAALMNRVRNQDKPGCRTVWLTAVGGGVFGNDPRWISSAIDRARLALPQNCDLEVHVGRYTPTSACCTIS